MKATLIYDFLSVPIAALPAAAGHLHTPAAQRGGARWIPGFAIPYVQYAGASTEPLSSLMVGSGMILFDFVNRWRRGRALPAQA